MIKEDTNKFSPRSELNRAIQSVREAHRAVSAYHEALLIALTFADKEEYSPFELEEAKNKINVALGALYNLKEWLDRGQKKED